MRRPFRFVIMENISGLDFGYLDRSLLVSLGIEIAALVEIFRGRDKGQLVQEGSRTSVRRYSTGRQEIYLKLYRPYGVCRWLPANTAYRRALQALNNARRLRELKIKTAPVLAVVKQDNDERTSESGLFTLSLFPAQGSILFFLNELSCGRAVQQRRQVLCELASFLWNLHEKGIYPKDCKHSNVLIRQTEQGYSFYLIDYDSFLFLNSVSCKRRLNNLYQISSTLGPALVAGEVRFLLECYGQRAGSLDHALERLERDIERRLREGRKE
jgi:hypothetical protein